MPTNGHRKQKWWDLKSKIIAHFGSLKKCAQVLDCSVEALRQTVDGRCPHVARKLEALFL